MAAGGGRNVIETEPPPKIYKASLGIGGDVIRGAQLGEAAAVAERRAGRDIVV
jgi:hypothetical protein